MEGALNIGLLEGTVIVFAMLLIFVLTFGFLNKTKPLGDGKDGLHSLIAIAITILIIVNRPVLDMILFMTPWFAIVLFILFFILFLVAVIGGESNLEGMKGTVITIALIIFVFAFMGYMSSPEVVDDEEEEEEENPILERLEVLLHPQVLGLVVMLAVAGFAVLLITKK